MGAGRSGSTIFGVALGNCCGIFDAGELEAWLRRSGVPNFGGKERTEFWQRVLDNVDGDDLFGDHARLCLEHSSSLFRVDRWRSRRQMRRRYREIAANLYHAVMSESGATHIVDTSHYPLRFRELQTLPNVEFYLLYLVRNPQDVIASFDRRDVAQRRMSPIAANAYLWLTHLISVFVFLRHRRDKRLLVCYEDFIANPEPVLRQIVDLVDAPAGTPELSSLTTGIPFQGNRVLQSETIALHSSASSTPAASFTSYLTKLLQLPWSVALSRLSPKATI